jgi:hypothetical protein
MEVIIIHFIGKASSLFRRPLKNGRCDERTFFVFLMAMLLFPGRSDAGINDPFAVGYSMGTNGAIIQAIGPSGRQPWNPACFFGDTLRFGASVCGIDYYDAMDNLESSHLVQVIAGAWYARKRFILKASYAHFNALNLYGEQQGYLSLGMRVCKAIAGSVEVTANRLGLLGEIAEKEKFVNAGVSVFISGESTAFSLSCGRFPIQHALSPGAMPPMGIDIGIHTTVHSFGAQGVVCSITKEATYVFRFSLGESYCIGDHCALCGAVSTNPFLLHAGITFSGDRGGVALAFVNHPVLGWSKGLTLDYAR